MNDDLKISPANGENYQQYQPPNVGKQTKGLATQTAEIAGSIHAILQNLLTTSTMLANAERINEIRALVDSGQYTVDQEQLAEYLIREFLLEHTEE